MENRMAGINGIIFIFFIYVVVFGIKVNIGEDTVITNRVNCKPVKVIVSKPPQMPIFKKENLNDKNYVIRILVNHITTLNDYIVKTNKDMNLSIIEYDKCIEK